MSRMPLLIAALAAAVHGCSPTSATAILTGTYIGAVEDDTIGGGTVQAEIVDSFGALTGTWHASGAGFLPVTYYIHGSTLERGEIRFNVSRSRLVEGGAIVIADGNCSYRMTGAVQGSTIVGTYDTFSCVPQRNGRFRLAR